MVALLWSTVGGVRTGCGADMGPEDEAGLAVPLLGEREVYEAAATCRFDFLTYAAVCPKGFLLCSVDTAIDWYAINCL